MACLLFLGGFTVCIYIFVRCFMYPLLFQGSMCDEIIWKFSYLQCKNVISKLQRRIDKEGQQIVPLLTDLWKRIEKHSYMSGSGNDLLDLRRIDQRVERLEYNGVMDLVCDVQFMLKGAMQFYGCSLEVCRPKVIYASNLYLLFLRWCICLVFYGL